MTDNLRDTKFLGFAKLLSDEIQNALRSASDTENLFDLEYTIIAQRAYDLVLHAFRDDTYELDYYQKSTYERTIMPTIQDLTQWPEPPPFQSDFLASLPDHLTEIKPSND